MRSDDVGAALESAVIDVLANFGRSRDLGGFEWRIVDYPDGHVIEGRPLASAENGVADAQGWAHALGVVGLFGFMVLGFRLIVPAVIAPVSGPDR